MRRKKVSICFWILPVFFLFCFSRPLFGETVAVPPSQVSGEAKRLIEKGIAASDAREWEIAVKYFQEAQKIEPLHPKILFNLGVASLNQGREVGADLWLRAYLAVAPEAANAAQVQKEINRLDVLIESKASKLIQESIAQLQALPAPMSADEKEAFQSPADPSAILQEAMSQLHSLASSGSSDGSTPAAGQTAIPDMMERRKKALGAILFAQIASGSILEATNFAAQMNLTAAREDSMKRFLGQIRADALDFAGAREVLGQILDPGERDHLLAPLIMNEIANEKLAEAEKDLSMLTSPSMRSGPLQTLVLKYVRQLEVERAETLLKTLSLSEEEKRINRLWVLFGHLKKGQGAAAEKIAAELLASAKIDDPAQLVPVSVSLVALGRASESFALLQKISASPVNFAKLNEAAVLSAQALCWSGQLPEAGKVMDLLKSVPGLSSQLEQTEIQMFLAAEKGDVDSILSLGQTLNAQERSSMIVSIFWRLAQAKLYGKAARLALGAESKLVRARLFLKLAGAVTGPDAVSQKKELLKQSFSFAVEARDVTGLTILASAAEAEGQKDAASSYARTAEALKWIELADYFSRIPATADLNKYLESLKLKSFDVVPYETALTAFEWNRVSVYIRAKEQND